MWLLNFIPLALLHVLVSVMLLVGLGLYALGILINFCPVWLQAYKQPIRMVSAVLIVAGIYGYGMYSADAAWQDKINAAERRVALAEQKAAENNTQIEYVYRDRVQVVHDVKYKTITVIQQAAARIDATCRVDPQVITILNDAAKNINYSGDKK